MRHTVLERSRQGAVVLDLNEARDRDLVARIARGDDGAFRDLFRRYAPTATALAKRVVRQQFLAEEIVQEAFLAVWRDARGYEEGGGSVRSWLMGMVHHRAVDLVRREESQRRRAEDPRLVEPAAAGEDLAQAVVDQVGMPEERRAVREALAELPREQQQVIELMYFGGMSQSKIADALGLPLGTVKSRTLLGMRRLRGALEGMER